MGKKIIVDVLNWAKTTNVRVYLGDTEITRFVRSIQVVDMPSTIGGIANGLVVQPKDEPVDDNGQDV